MKKLRLLGVAALIFATITLAASKMPGDQDRDGDQRVKDRFVGAWRLVSLEAHSPDGKIQKANSIGMFVFTRDGHASVQVMERNRQPRLRPDPSSTRTEAMRPRLVRIRAMRALTRLLFM